MAMIDYDDYIDDAVAAISERIESIESNGTRLENNPGEYPERIMRDVRGSLGLDEFDDSMDDKINNMSPDEVLNNVCIWNGLINFSGTIKSWVMDIYGIDLDNSNGGKVSGK